MISIYFNNWIWSCFYWLEDINLIFWNYFNRNVCYISKFESCDWSRNCWLNRNHFWCIWWSLVNWNIICTIKFNNFMRLIINWNIFLIINNNYMSWIIWLGNLWLNLFRFNNNFCFEQRFECFWNNW